MAQPQTLGDFAEQLHRPRVTNPSTENFPGANLARDECEFALAVENYRQKFRRRFPTFAEILYVAKCLGYRKVLPRQDP